MNCIIGETVHGDYLELGREGHYGHFSRGLRSARVAYNIV